MKGWKTIGQGWRLVVGSSRVAGYVLKNWADLVKILTCVLCLLVKMNSYILFVLIWMMTLSGPGLWFLYYNAFKMEPFWSKYVGVFVFVGQDERLYSIRLHLNDSAWSRALVFMMHWSKEISSSHNAFFSLLQMFDSLYWLAVHWCSIVIDQ